MTPNYGTFSSPVKSEGWLEPWFLKLETVKKSHQKHEAHRSYDEIATREMNVFTSTRAIITNEFQQLLGITILQTISLLLDDKNLFYSILSCTCTHTHISIPT
jgi:hypothetical protein